MSSIKPPVRSLAGEEISQPQVPTLVGKALALARVNGTDSFRALVIPDSLGGLRYRSLRWWRPGVVAYTASCAGESSHVAPTPYLFNFAIELPFLFTDSSADSDNVGDPQQSLMGAGDCFQYHVPLGFAHGIF